MLELLGNGEICTNAISCWPLQLRRPATQYAAPINDNLVWGLFEDARGGRNSSIYSLGSDISLAIKPLALTTHPSPTHSSISVSRFCIPLADYFRYISKTLSTTILHYTKL
jgi:hypothetical protein